MAEKEKEIKGPDSEEENREDALATAQERAARHLKDHGLGEIEQTKITLFLQSTQLAKSVILPKVAYQNMDWLPYKFFHQQFYRNSELSTLLARATKWTLDPFVYMKYWEIASYFSARTDLLKHFSLNFAMNDAAVQLYEFLAFSHALLSEIRTSPLVLDLPENDYTRLLFELEEENGRQIQLQIRLLKGIDLPLSLDEKEEIILSEREKVGAVFQRFLGFLCER